MYFTMFFSGILLVELALIVALIWKYRQTRDAGFIWLGVAVAIWPVLSYLLDRGEALMIGGTFSQQSVGFYPLTAIERGQLPIGRFLLTFHLLQKLIGATLSLVAVLHFYRTKTTI